MSAGIALDESTFDEFVRSADRPVLIDFWAPWCGPCKVLDPVLEDIAREDDRFILVSVDSDQNPTLGQRFGVMSVPTIVLVRGDDVVWQSVGSRGRTRMEEDLDRAFGYRLKRPARSQDQEPK